jgi:membrane-bound lytic murein transglycosylase B
MKVPIPMIQYHRFPAPSRFALVANALSLILSLHLAAACLAASNDGDPYAELKNRLKNDGFSSMQIASLFDPPPPLQYSLISKTLAIKESRLDYEQFLAPSSMAIARRNLTRYASAFDAAERRHGVHRSVIAAIILVETRFGGYTGGTPTLAVLASYAVMNQPHHQDKIWAQLSPKDRKRWGREAFEHRLRQRSEWAYPEIRALLTLSESQGLRVAMLRGSVMGAFGWPQFLPSSLLKCGADGNGDGVVDLDQPEDAIHSAANYLKAHGWTSARTRAEQEAVIFRYNKSTPYVQTVLAIAERLGVGE